MGIITGTSGSETLSGTLEDDEIYGREGNDTLFGFAGNDFLYGEDGNDVLRGMEGSDTLFGGYGTNELYGNDGDDLLKSAGAGINPTNILDGGAGNDTAEFVINYIGGAGPGVNVNLSIVGQQNTGFGYDTLINIENLRGSSGRDNLTGNTLNNTLEGMSGDDILEGGGGNDVINGGGLGLVGSGGGSDTASYATAASAVTVNLSIKNISQNTQGAGIDTLISIENLIGSAFNDNLTGDASANKFTAGAGNDLINGDLGVDTVVFNITRAAVTEVRHLKTGGAYIVSSNGTDTLFNIESLQFTDNTVTAGASGDVIRDLIATRAIPSFAGATNAVTLYSGAVAWLEYENLGTASNNAVTGSNGNDFINLLGGDDAASGGLGDDIIDGGTGSNFLTGGGGNEIFFIDGRGGANSWATITDFNSGDQINIWGWVVGTSRLLLTQENAGVQGYSGVTYHYDLNNDNMIDTSITFTGLAAAQVPASQAFSGYLLIG